MLQPQDLRFIFLFSDIVGLENLQDQCLALLKLRTLKGFNGLKLTVDLETEIVNGREFTRYMMPTGKKKHNWAKVLMKSCSAFFIDNRFHMTFFRILSYWIVV